GRCSDQRLQAFLRGRVAADFELVEIERLRDLAGLDLGGVGIGLFSLSEEGAADDAENHADQHENDEDFDQGHTACVSGGPKGAGASMRRASARGSSRQSKSDHWNPFTERFPSACPQRLGTLGWSLDTRYWTSSLMPMTPSRIEKTMPPISTASERINA